jgi:DegV family protein with EDD domain
VLLLKLGIKYYVFNLEGRSLEHKIAIVTDSTCDLDLESIKEQGIHVVPLRVVYKDREFRDRVEISPEQVYESLEKEIPKTSMPSPGEVRELFLKLQEQGFTHAVSIHISSGLSGTFSVVTQIAKEIQGMRIEVIDSKALSMGLGFPVLEAINAVKANLSFEEVIHRVQSVVERIKVFFVVSTLEYLKQGGRIGYVSATLGEILQLKPIISINEEGKYITHSKVRGRKQSLSRLFELVQEQIKDKMVNVAVLQGAAYEECMELVQKFRSVKNIKELVSKQIGPSMVVHTGPGLVGVAFYEV